ncbi:MAG: flagellar biosynthesis protein FlhA, partial [Halioglobus sp.]|nr:flagellar biosynthesis protein FlhA [Halioglobus sp.]
GDGLVAQIPSLLLSTATAVIVTRVSDSQDMGQQVISQLFGAPKAVLVAASLIGVMGLVPGMPHLVFLSLAALMGGFGYSRMLEEQAAQAEPEPVVEDKPEESQDISWDDVATVDEIGLEVGYRLIVLVDRSHGGELLSRIKGVRKKLSQELGFLIHSVHIRDNLELSPNEYRISVHDVAVGEGEVYPGKELAINPGQVFGQLDGVATKDPTFGLDAVWIEPTQRDDAQAMGFTVVDCGTVIATHLSQVLKQHAHELLGQDGVQQLLDKLGRTSPKLVENLVPGQLGLGEVTRVMQNLLSEGVSIRDIRTIAEALAEHSGKSQDTDALTAQVRVALGRTIYQEVNGVGGEMAVMTLDTQLEQILQGAIQGAGGGLEPSLMESVINQIGQASERLAAQGNSPVLLVAGGIRLFLSKLLRGRTEGLHVLAYEEIPATKNIKVVEIVGSQAPAASMSA